MAKYVLEHSLGCKVKITQITEVPVYQAMADGKTDAVLEDWGHVTQQKQYVAKQKSVVAEGPNGVIGVIGWYIPDYLMKQYPQFKTWKGLKGKETIFKSPESGSQGMFLGGDPSYQQKDRQLIKGSGSTSSSSASARGRAGRALAAAESSTACSSTGTTRVPERHLQARPGEAPAALRGCQDDETKGGDPKKYACAYDLPAAEVLQQEVRDERLARRQVPEEVEVDERRPERGRGLIAGKHMDPDKAAATWVKANQAESRPGLLSLGHGSGTDFGLSPMPSSEGAEPP